MNRPLDEHDVPAYSERARHEAVAAAVAAERERWLPLLRAMHKLYDVVWNQTATLDGDVPGYNLISYDDTNAIDEAGSAVEDLLAHDDFSDLIAGDSP